MVLEDKKIIFVHIPRTGGTSIENFFDFKGTDFGNPETAQHQTIKEYKKNYNIKKYFTFTFVRNPWDRLVSWYIWTQAEVAFYAYLASVSRPWFSSTYFNWYHGRELLQDSSQKIFDKKFFLKFKDGFSDFVYSLKDKSLMPDARFNNCNMTDNRLNGRWIMPQVKWLKDGRGKINLDYIGKFEEHNSHFKSILSKKNIPYKKMPLLANICRKPHYTKFYTKETAEIVGRIYKEDWENFNYNFES